MPYYLFVVHFQVRGEGRANEWQLPVLAQRVEQQPHALIHDRCAEAAVLHTRVA